MVDPKKIEVFAVAQIIHVCIGNLNLLGGLASYDVSYQPSSG